MSFWFSYKDKSGRNQVIGVDFLPPVIIILVGMVAAIILPNLLIHPAPFFYLFCATTGMGLILFLISKASLFSKGMLLTFGTKAMSKPFRVCYYLGYALIVLGALGVLVTMVIYGGKG